MSSLTLHLRPGLSYPPARIWLAPASDIPSEPVSVEVPLHPDAVPATTHPTRPFFSYPSNPYLKAAVAEYQLALDWNDVATWYREHFEGSGFRFCGSGQSSHHEVQVSRGYQFKSLADPDLEVWVALERAPAGGTLLLYVAQRVTLPPREVESYLPDDVVRVEMAVAVAVTPAAAVVTHRDRVLDDPATIRQLVEAVNSLSRIAAGTVSGPPELREGATLVFTRSDGSVRQVAVKPATMGVAVDSFRPLLDDGGRVWNVV
ncbi:MAG: hypothetical protein JOZ41_21850, partial [Chloroflexi bacterium]|nr:hypothetical protein [Chloroflexota bacterium]